MLFYINDLISLSFLFIKAARLTRRLQVKNNEKIIVLFKLPFVGVGIECCAVEARRCKCRRQTSRRERSSISNKNKTSF